MYWDRDMEQSTENEEHIWLGEDDICVLYLPKEDDNDRKLTGVHEWINTYLKRIINRAINESEEEAIGMLAILGRRIRGKLRVNKHGKILSVHGIISQNTWDFLEEKLDMITNLDENYSSNANIESYKIGLNDLIPKLGLNAIYAIRIYDQFGKEMKLYKSVKNVLLFVSEPSAFITSLKDLCTQLNDKYNKTKRVITSMTGAYGMRYSFNTGTNTIKLTTSAFTYKFKVNHNKQLVVSERIGLKWNGW